MKMFVSLVAIVSTALLISCGKDEAKTIGEPHIAVIAPLTGPAAIYGEWIRRGIDKSIIDGAKAVRYDFLDSAGDPKTAVTLAQRALSNSSTIALWTVSSADTMAVRDLATQNGATLVTSSATSPDITDGRTNVFRTIVNSAQETEVLVQYAAQTVKPSKAAVLYINDAGGKASLEQFRTFFGKQKVSIVFEDSFEKNASDVRVMLSKALATHPDIVVVTGYSAVMGRIVNGIRDISRDIPIFCNQGLEIPENLSLPPRVLTRIRYSVAYMDDNTNVSAFRSEYEKRYGKPPGLYEITAYDTANLINDNVIKGGAGRAQFREILRRAAFKGINGTYRFSPRGNVVKEVAIKAVERGKVTLEAKSVPTVE